MDIFLYVVLIVVGIALIVKCGDWFVDSASWVAKISGIPTFVIGATIVSLGTTLPEIITSCIAAGQGSVELAIGNAVGSVNANIGLIMAISLMFIPAIISRKDFFPKAGLLILAIGSLWAVCIPGQLYLGLSFIILGIFALFIVENLLSAKRHKAKEINDESFENEGVKEEKYRPKGGKEIAKYIILFIIGAAGIAGGAFLLSTFGEKLALRIGDLAGVDPSLMSSIVGVTIIAIGTSLPELTTTIIAITKKQHELSIGNIIGANIIDITLILPLCTIISAISTGNPLPVNTQTLYLDLPYCLLAASLAVVPPLIFKKTMRWQGFVLIATYAGYITLLFLRTFGVLTF